MRKLVQLRTVPLDATERRLGSCYDIADLRRAAKRRIPRPVFDYVDGAADEEIAVAANAAAFRSWRFLPRVLAGVAAADTSAPGSSARRCRCRSLLGPTGYTRMLHPDGEIGGGAVGRAARAAVHAVDDGDDRDRGAAGQRRAGAPDAVVPAVPDQGPGAVATTWCDRAADSGYAALVVTVDTVVAGNRVRDLRNGLSIPPELTAGARSRRWRLEPVVLVPAAVRAGRSTTPTSPGGPTTTIGRRPTSSTPT